MESLTISLKEIFRKGIANSKIQSVCQFGDADYLMCTKKQVFHFSAFRDSGNSLSKLNCTFKTSIFIKNLNIICAIGSSLPNIIFYSTRSGFPLICEAYRLSSTLYDTIKYSTKSKKLIVSGDTVEIFDLIVEWKLFEIDPMITLVNKLSFSCERMTSNVYLDEMRQILIIPSLFGISTVNISNLKGSPNYNLEHAVSNYQLGSIPFQTMAFYNSQKISKKRSISNVPFKNLITTNSNGDICLWNSSSIKKGHPIQNYKRLNEISIICEFVDNEFCIFVTENLPNYFVILFDVKTGKTIKLTSFDTKVIEMNILSKRSVSFLTEDFYVVYQLNIPWHLFSKTASNAVAIRRYPALSFHAKAARVATLFNDGIVSLFSPDVHFLLTEIGTTCSSKIIDFIYDRSSSLRIKDKIISLKNVSKDDFQFFNTTNQSNPNLNPNLATSNFEKNKIVSFEFADDNSHITNRIQTETDLQNDNSPKNVNFLISLLQLRKKQELRKFMEIGERFIFLLDDGTVQVFNSDNDRFTLSRSITTMNLISFALTYIREEDENEINISIPCFIGFNKEGELLSFRFDNFEVLSRTAVTTNVSKGRLCPLFVCIHHRSNSIYAIYENQILIIDSSSKKVIQTVPLNSKPKSASLEDDLLLIVYENREIQIRHLNIDQHPPTTESIKLLENVTFSIVQYETFIIVTDDKTVRIGHTFDNCAIFEFPFKIFSAGFLNPDLDLALGLDYEVMVIRRSIWYPFIEKPFHCNYDTSDPKTEDYITAIHNKAVLYNIKDEWEEKSGTNSDDSSSSSLPDDPKNNLLSFVTQKVNKSQASLDLPHHSKVKNISHHMSSPNIVSPSKSKQHAAFSFDGSSSPLNRMKKLPDLRSNDEMMNDKQFLALFKDVGSGLNDGAGSKRKTDIFAEPKPCEEKVASDTSHSSNNKTKPPKATARSKNSETSDDQNDDENRQRTKIKKKKRVSKKNPENGTRNINADSGPIHHKDPNQGESEPPEFAKEEREIGSPPHRPKPPSEPLNSSPHPRIQSVSKSGDKPSPIVSECEDEDANGSGLKADPICIEERNSDQPNINRKSDTKPLKANEVEADIASTGGGSEPAFSSKSTNQSAANQAPPDSNSTPSGADINVQHDDDATKPVSRVESANSPCLPASPESKDKPRGFISLGAKSELTKSSPDLVLLQSHLGNVKLTVDKSSKDEASESCDLLLAENRKELPLVTVHLVQRKTIRRTKSEYSFVRCIDQPIFDAADEPSRKRELGAIGMQAQRLAMKNKPSQIIVDENRGVNEMKKMKEMKNGSGMLSIRHLLANEKREQKTESFRNGKEKSDFIVPKRTDRQPLGNVELAIQIFHPNSEKK